MDISGPEEDGSGHGEDSPDREEEELMAEVLQDGNAYLRLLILARRGSS